MNFQIVKVNVLHKIIGRKAGLVMLLKICDIGVEPDRFAKVKLAADRIKRIKHLVRARIGALIADDSILDHMIVLKCLSP